MSAVSKRIRIPDQDVTVSPLELAVMQTGMFQRMFSLKQLGLAYMVYPGATHSRAHHSLRCMAETERILRVLPEGIVEPHRGDVRLAALLHDIAHVPFSHTLEDEHAVLSKHDRPERLTSALALLEEELAESGASLPASVQEVLLSIADSADDGVSKKDWRSDIVGNTVCADLLAYITTDAQWTGIEKRPGYYRIYDYFRIIDGRLCIELTKGGLRNDIVSAILDLLDMRYALTERVFFHHAKCVASAMLARAARLVGLQFSERLFSMGDETFFGYLEQLAVHQRVDGAIRLLEGLRCRRLHQRIFKVATPERLAWEAGRCEDGESVSFCARWRESESVERLLTETEREVDLPRGTLALWCPKADAGMKLVEANVVWDTEAAGAGSPVKLRSPHVESRFPEVHSRVRAIEEQYKGLWTFWITMDRAFVDRAPVVVRAVEERMGIHCDRTFLDAYLSRLPGFKTGLAAARAVSSVMQGILPGIVETLGGGSGDVAPLLSRADILRAGASIIEGELGGAPSQETTVDGDVLAAPIADAPISLELGKEAAAIVPLERGRARGGNRAVRMKVARAAQAATIGSPSVERKVLPLRRLADRFYGRENKPLVSDEEFAIAVRAASQELAAKDDFDLTSSWFFDLMDQARGVGTRAS